jgi:4-amino-4-deoxy-L-arabinose transferase-like glycosyltransferase
MGVASVGLLFATVRRSFTASAGLLAGAVLAVTPVATVMFRFNNPDALLVLLLVAAAYALVRAVESGSTRWLVLVGVAVGFAFLTKMLQALLVVPAFALVYLVAAPRSIGRRIGQLLIAGVAMVVSAGWYIALVELIPASSRPYIGGSQHNSILELTLGYNGLGRLTGNETGSVGGGAPGGAGGGGGFWGQTGIGRLFSSDVGGQVAWLIPAALLLGAGALWFLRRAPRTDRTRVGLLLWGGWLLTTGLVFSYMQGIFHPYYTIALAPAIGALVGTGAVLLWRHRDDLVARGVLSVTLAITAAWSYVLLNRTPDWHPALRVGVLVVGLVAAAAVALPSLTRTVAATVAVAAVAAGLAGPIAYSLDTASTGKSGSIVSAGPVAAFGPGGGFGRAGGQRFGRGGLGFAPPNQGGQGFGGQGFGGQGLGQPGQTGTNGTGQNSPFAGGRFGGGAGGLLQGSNPGSALVALLEQNSASYTWVAAAIGSNSASGYQLASGKPVMPIGGFNGSDPSPTLEQFQSYVQQGKIHYFIASGFGGGGFRSQNGSNASSEIASWVADNFTATTVGGTTVYDLTSRT